MKIIRNILLYLVVIGGFIALIYGIISSGSKLEIQQLVQERGDSLTHWANFLKTLQENLSHPLAILLIQIIAIISVSRMFGWVFKKIGQPTVVGEIIAGIALGPSLLGMYFPDATAMLFPPHSMPNLQFLSQIGLILFMFIVGMEVDMKFLRDKARDAVVISNTSIVVPFTLGLGLSYFIFESFAPEGISFIAFGLFIGIAMSITAFPVLARIVQERGIHKTRLGTIIIASAAVDDISAWSLLAAVIAIVKAGSFVSSLYIIILAVAYVLVMLFIVRPFLKRIGDLHPTKESLNQPIVAIFILVLIISSWTTEVIGIHALFGAFMAGTIMPENIRFRNIFIEKIEDISLVMLLPLFFVFTGLRTEIGLINDMYLWKVTGMIILVAIAGKFLGSAIAAKVVGQSWKNSLTIGALMNTRGLVELVVLNIGYDLGVLKPEIFAMMVIMALVTTFLTGPSLNLINRLFKDKPDENQIIDGLIKRFKILISFGKPESGKSLLRLASTLVGNNNHNQSVTVMHLFPSTNSHHYNVEEYENNCFSVIKEEAELHQQKITTFFKVSNDIENDIIETANKGNYDLLLVGIGQSIFEGSLLGRILGFTTRMINPDRIINQVTRKEGLFETSPLDERTRTIINRSSISVGVLLDKGLGNISTICLPVVNEKDLLMFQYAKRMMEQSSIKVELIIFNSTEISIDRINKSLTSHNILDRKSINNITENMIDQEFFKKIDLMLISLDSWKYVLDLKSQWLALIPSTLIISLKPNQDL